MRVVLFFLAVLAPLFSVAAPAAVRPPDLLSQDVYVWQRAHTAAVGAAVRTHGGAFDTVIVLAAEVSWKKAGSKLAPVITRVSPDWSALRTIPRLGLALRINAYPGPFARDDAPANVLTALARDLLAEAAANGAAVAEFQVDFDAATAKLAGYQAWLEALRDSIAPVPLVFTALPAWLRSPDFSPLARSAHGYVLQVHSLARPDNADRAFTLCDPAAARAVIERAAGVGVPFRVALPTYGYALAFDTAGRFAGLSAEGPRPEWRKDFTVREVRADAAQLAALVRALAADHPASLIGLIWYRLPVAGDRLNWSWPALASVMAGRAPVPHLHAVPAVRGDGLLDLILINDGEGDFSGPVRVVARWHEAHRTGADALGAFSITTEDETSLQLTSASCLLPAYTRRVVGWLRLSNLNASPDVFLEN